MLHRTLVLGATALTTAALSACGGGGDRASDAATPTATPTPFSRPVALAGGTTTLRLDAATRKLLDFAGVHVTAAGAATASGRRLSFPVAGGNLRFAPLRGRIDHRGALRFSAAGHSVEATNLEVRPGQKMLTADLAGHRVPLLRLDFSLPLRPPPAGGPVVLPGKAALIGGQAVSLLGDRLGVPVLKAGLPLGSVNVTVRPAGA